jgi:hypothetical protein
MWQSRRIIYTKTTLFICRAHNDEVHDLIPLDEIAKILDEDTAQEDQSNLWTKQADNDEESSVPATPGPSNVMRIETIPEGYNSGRTYHIQVNGSD